MELGDSSARRPVKGSPSSQVERITPQAGPRGPARRPSEAEGSHLLRMAPCVLHPLLGHQQQGVLLHMQDSDPPNGAIRSAP